MLYSDLIKSGADTTNLQRYLSEGDQVAVTIRRPANLRDAAKKAVGLWDMSFSAMVRSSLIDQFVEGSRR